MTGTDTSVNRAIASLLALDSEPPPKKSKSAGLTKFPAESNSTIEPLSLFRSKASSLYCRPKAISILPAAVDPISPEKTRSTTSNSFSDHVS